MNELEEEDITRIVECYKNCVNVDKFAYKARYLKLKKIMTTTKYSRYVDTFEEETPIDLDVVHSKIKDAKRTKTQATLDVVNQMLHELGVQDI